MRDRPETAGGPWLEPAMARSFLGMLVGEPARPFPDVDVAQLGAWLVAMEIGPRAYGRFRHCWPELAAQLQGDWFASAAENALHLESLRRLAAALPMPVVVLKGAALAQTVYDDAGERPMSDIDVWVPPTEMRTAYDALRDSGLLPMGNADRPWSLQSLAGGELPLFNPAWQQSRIELHLSPLAGWWLRRTAAVDEAGMWQRKVRLLSMNGRDPGQLYHLSPEDTVLQVAVHLVVNHQVGMAAMRGLLDLALAGTQGVAWEVVAQRARQWRIGTAVWLGLWLTAVLYGLDGAAAVAALRPSRWRQWWLRRLISPEKVLAGQDLRNGRQRYLFLLLLVDRPQDMVRLLWRTIWPEAAWLTARYGRPRRWHHVWQVVRHGSI